MRYPGPATLIREQEPQPMAPQGNWVQRRPNPWLRLTSFGWNQPQRTLEQRERVRRSRLTSWIILGLLVMELAIMPAGLYDPPTLVAAGGAFIGTLIAAALNRFGFINSAGILLVVLVWGAIIGAITSAPNGNLDTIYLPGYDLFAITVVLGASILPRAAAFPIALLNVATIIVDFTLQPKVGDLARWLAIEGPVPLVARPIALQIIIAVVAFLWVRGTDDAIRRADRAEEIAALEHSIAEQKRQLDLGIQQLLQTHVRAANGDFGARAPLSQENVLWQIASSLNNLLGRMQRAAQADHQLARTEEELRRLAAAIDDAQAGRQPLWPAPTGTAADLILERIARGQRRRSVPSTGFDQGRTVGSGQTPVSQGWPSLSSQPLGQSPYGPPPSSQPLGPSPFGPTPPSQPLGQPAQSSYGADGWPPAAPQSGPMEPPPPSPWIIPADQPEQPQ